MCDLKLNLFFYAGHNIFGVEEDKNVICKE